MSDQLKAQIKHLIVPALGLSVGLARRIRRVFWIFIGWTCLSYMSRTALQRRASTALTILQEQENPR